MARHTTFRFCLDPTVEQSGVLSRHAGAARFAFNHCLQVVKTSLSQRSSDPKIVVPWTGFDLINEFNKWKKSVDAGRIFAVDGEGVAEVVVTGLAWRNQVCQQVFEEAAVDCGRALTAWPASRSGKRRGRRVGFPRFKRKATAVRSFRLRNKRSTSGRPLIRVGECDRPRSVVLPGIGSIAVLDDTRRLRRMLAKQRAKILFAALSHRAGRWWISLTVEAADLHPDLHHSTLSETDRSGWVGVDRGLSAFVVAATSDGTEVARITDPPRALAARLHRQRRLAKSVSRKRKGSNRYNEARARLRRHHRHVADIRRHFLHSVSNKLVKTHDRLVLEDLDVAGMLRNHRLARAISDASWAEFARLLEYKQRWRHGRVEIADRWFPSSRLCAACGRRNAELTLADRVFTCGCGYRLDRGLNAAINLARWAAAQHEPPDPQAGGRVINAR
ncbi:RNA-guided endonuclease InsQ/TnpB family protein [Nocardia nova]|uniref:RNA-guided endonuclease InsQ/TnpB family protein n=1 Tax=Nocardia nova TaxID=37330 RepID=UPI002739B6A9|nr:RNA-guided endonuclease TnpB family protein [Nocardia nova]